MGIRGLTTYIKKYPNLTESYELHGGILVIDGYSVAAELFFTAGCNSSFAGELDKYAEWVSIFIDRLRQCEITPLVMLAGGTELKKKDESIARKLSYMELIGTCTPVSEAENQRIVTIALGVVFEAVLQRKGVKMVRCIFDAHASIAGVAKILDCPVLSSDSDFYIFGIKYIPVKSLEPLVARCSSGRGYAITCALLSAQFLSRAFPSLNLSTLPLMVVLLGNDNMTTYTTERFFAGMWLSSASKRLYCTEQRRIDTLFRWLCNYNLENATAAILSKMPKNCRKELLRKIELVVNRYVTLRCEMLEPLGLTEKYRTKIADFRQLKKFHFSRDIDTLDAREFWSEEELAAGEHASSKEEIGEDEPILDLDCADALVKTWPAWFARHYHVGNLPSYFVEMKAYGSFDVYVQIENFEYPSAHSMSMKIVQVIHGLLVAGCPDESARGLTYTIREGPRLVDRHVDTVNGTRTTSFPALSDLAKTPRPVRKQIFDDTLEISGLEALVDDVPDEWRLYVIAIVYWMRQPDEPLRNSCHMHAVLFAMLSGVVDRKIGFYRSRELFDDCYGKTLIELKLKLQGEKPDKADEECGSIVEALKFVSSDDCILAAPIFIELCAIDLRCYRKPRNFNVTIVHVFAQFLSCIKEALHLNALLGRPYKPLNIGDFFNGTMLFNLFTRLEKLSDVEAYNYETLKESPSIGHLLKVLTAKVKEIIAAAPLDDCSSPDAGKLADDEPSEQASPDEISAAQSQLIDLHETLSTLAI